MKKLLILILCLFSFNVAFALPDIPEKQLPQFKKDVQKILDNINSDTACIDTERKSCKQYLLDTRDKDYILYQNFKKNPYNVDVNLKNADLFLDHSASIDALADDLLADMDILFKKYKTTINYKNIEATPTQNTYDFLCYYFKKYNIKGYKEFDELLTLMNSVQNSLLDWREEIRKYYYNY